jgi:L-ribulose-5-phosphate 3-epimerase
MNLKSINYWSIPGGLEGTAATSDFLRAAAESSFDAVEICIGEPGSAFGLDATEQLCRSVVAEAEGLGIKIPSVASGLYWSRSLGDSDATARSRALDDLKKMLRIASWLGAKTLLTIPGSVDIFFQPNRPAQPYQEVWDNASEGLLNALEAAESHGVKIGIENVWNKFLVSPLEMARFIDQFQSPWIGAYVDVANLAPWGYAEDWLRQLGNRVVGVHFKDFRRSVGSIDGFVDLLEGDTDWPAVMAAIRDIGYPGPLVAEMIPCYQHHPMVRIANASRAMDAILGR